MTLSRRIWSVMHKAESNFKCSTSPVSPIYGLAGFVMLASELWKQWTLTYAINDGHYIWWYLPFQLCSIPMYICLTLGILFLLSCYTDSSACRTTYCHISSRLQSFLMDFGLLGGIFAFFDTSGMHYGYLPLTIHSYAWHILLITLGFISGLDHRTDHTKKGLQFSVYLYLGCCLIATVLNLTLYPLGTINMFYISPHYTMQQKVFCQIAKALGNGWGIGSYIAMSVVGAGVLHKGWNLLYRRHSPVLL